MKVDAEKNFYRVPFFCFLQLGEIEGKAPPGGLSIWGHSTLGLCGRVGHLGYPPTQVDLGEFGRD